MKFVRKKNFWFNCINVAVAFFLFTIIPQDSASDTSKSSSMNKLESIPSKLEKDIEFANTLFLVASDWDPRANFDAALIDRMVENILRWK